MWQQQRGRYCEDAPGCFWLFYLQAACPPCISGLIFFRATLLFPHSLFAFPGHCLEASYPTFVLLCSSAILLLVSERKQRPRGAGVLSRRLSAPCTTGTCRCPSLQGSAPALSPSISALGPIPLSSPAFPSCAASSVVPSQSETLLTPCFFRLHLLISSPSLALETSPLAMPMALSPLL